MKYKKSYTKLKKIYNTLFKTFGPQHWWPGDTEFEVCVGAVLTQNTNWSNVERAIHNLKKANLLNPLRLNKCPNSRLALLIKPSGYYNLKAKRLKSLIKFLVCEYDADFKKMKGESTADLRKKLLSVNGIGKETADSILLYALEFPVFVVDAYTKRILLRLELIKESYDYNEIQMVFHTCLKPDVQIYNQFHALFVKLGKDYCKKKNPRCDICPIKNI